MPPALLVGQWVVRWLERDVCTDETPARLVEGTRTMLERDLFDLLEGTADAAFAVGEGGEIRSWNAGAERLFGFRRHEAIGRSCTELLQPCSALGTPYRAERRQFADGASRPVPVPDFDIEVRTRDGGRLWVNVSILVHEEAGGGRCHLVHLARSIADRRRSELLVHRLVGTARELVETVPDAPRLAPVSPLSEQERRILRLFAEGRRPGEIVRDLGITPQTLRNHLHHINQKLDTHNRLQAVIHALRRKLI